MSEPKQPAAPNADETVTPSSAHADLTNPTHRAGFVALVGAPNAGKSTLINNLVGAKVAIVTHKAQTTRAPIRGIAIEGTSQLIFVDTPGIFRPRRRLDRAMVHSALGAAADADVVVLLVDAARGLDEDTERILDKLGEIRQPRLLALNKIDKTEKPDLLALTTNLSARLPFEAVFMISALSGDGVGDLRKDLAGRVPLGHWLYPEDEISDAPMRALAAEITREKIYIRLHEELPYISTVETSQWTELGPGKGVRIEQTIFVERDSQKQIVIGTGGQMIKELSMASRKELSQILEMPVHLFLFVKVRQSWGDDPERYREMGLEFPEK